MNKVVFMYMVTKYFLIILGIQIVLVNFAMLMCGLTRCQYRVKLYSVLYCGFFFVMYGSMYEIKR